MNSRLFNTCLCVVGVFSDWNIIPTVGQGRSFGRNGQKYNLTDTICAWFEKTIGHTSGEEISLILTAYNIDKK